MFLPSWNTLNLKRSRQSSVDFNWRNRAIISKNAWDFSAKEKLYWEAFKVKLKSQSDQWIDWVSESWAFQRFQEFILLIEHDESLNNYFHFPVKSKQFAPKDLQLMCVYDFETFERFEVNKYVYISIWKIFLMVLCFIRDCQIEWQFDHFCEI